MGHENKKYKKSLHQQAHDALSKMYAFGESKKKAKKEGSLDGKIFSYNTYKTYWKHIKYFLKYVEQAHPECTTLSSCEQYVSEWLQSRTDQGLSAWTIQTEAKALGKLFVIKPEDPEYFVPPVRRRADIKRSRYPCARDKHFSLKNNDEFIRFCRGTGLRRREITDLKGGDLLTREDINKMLDEFEHDGCLSVWDEVLKKTCEDTLYFTKGEQYFLNVIGKGGRLRFSPIIGEDTEQIVERIKNTPPDAKVWSHVSQNADIHGYRSDYATNLYRIYARKIEDIPYDQLHEGIGNLYQSDVYVCRKDERLKRLDRKAMLVCSKALGHNRISIVAENYLRGL